MNDAVDTVIVERQRMDHGFPGSLLLSLFAHLMMAGLAMALPALLPGPKLITAGPFEFVRVARGGKGVETAEPPAPAPSVQPEAPPQTAPPKPEEAPPKPSKVKKPPRDEQKHGLPPPDSKTKGKPTPPPRTPAAGVQGGTGKGSHTLGIPNAPEGPGVPDGRDGADVDWYLTGVQRKIWVLWIQQIRTMNTTQPVTVEFTILADGKVTDIKVLQSSGNYMLDSAAQRAIFTAAPFATLPKDYGTNRYTIQAIFKPTS